MAAAFCVKERLEKIMANDKKYQQVNLDLETFGRLRWLADRGDRPLIAQVRRLVDRAWREAGGEIKRQAELRPEPESER